MDPNANLKEQLELARAVQALWEIEDETPDLEEIATKAARLAELVLALDGWRRRGGFDPWEASRAR